MEMNHLTTQQVVLLCILVSFVTSITTGISVVSLLEQTPEPVTQTINRVVEKTIERVVTAEPDEGDRQVETIIETVVVNQEDLTIEAVAKNSKSLVRISNNVGFVGIGVIVSADGRVVTDSILINPALEYGAKVEGQDYVLSVQSSEGVVALLKIDSSETTFQPAIFSDSNGVKLGQSVISLSGQTNDKVSTGIVTSINTVTGSVVEGEEPTSSIVEIETSVSAGNVLGGSILLNLQGEIVGVRISGDPLVKTSFSPSNSVASFLAGLSS
jgi:S1-C subfamily serine protease